MVASGDEPVDTAYQERHLAWASGRLGLVPRRQLVYHKYRDRAHLQRVTGHDPTNGFAEPGTGEGSLQELDRTRELFSAAYGFSLESARDRWLEFLEGRP